MLKDKAYTYFIEKDHNCAEAALLSIAEEYGLDVSNEDMKLVSAFGAGMGCGSSCGALCGALAAVGKIKVDGRAHATAGFGPMCGEFVKAFEDKLGSTMCSELKPKYRNDQTRCLKTVELGLEVFEEFAEEKGFF